MPDSISDAKLKQLSGTISLPVTATLSGTPNVQIIPTVTSIATSVYKINSLATVNAAVVKATAGRLYGYDFCNLTAAWKFVRFYNKATAPVVGTDVPIFVHAVPPNGLNDAQLTFSIAFTLGIGIAITGAAPDLDATVVAVNDVVGSVLYL